MSGGASADALLIGSKGWGQEGELMRVLVTGHSGYIGSVMVDVLARAGHEIVGLDTYLFEECTLGRERGRLREIRGDVRQLDASHLRGFDAVIHLAALSSNPLDHLNPQLTYDINYRASLRLARVAREAGVGRFLFASSCSVYGAAAHHEPLTEEAPCNPTTPSGTSKLLVERAVSQLADDGFSPVFLRSASAYGVSPRLRADVLVNRLVAFAVATGEIPIQSRDTSWRPVVHVEDISRAFLAALEAPRRLVHNRAFNVGRTQENHQIRDLAGMIGEVVPGSRVVEAPGDGWDVGCSRVVCDELEWTLSGFRPQWTVRDGIRELYEAYRVNGLTYDDLDGPRSRYLRKEHIERLQSSGRLDEALLWRVWPVSPSYGEYAGAAAPRGVRI